MNVLVELGSWFSISTSTRVVEVGGPTPQCGEGTTDPEFSALTVLGRLLLPARPPVPRFRLDRVVGSDPMFVAMSFEVSTGGELGLVCMAIC